MSLHYLLTNLDLLQWMGAIRMRVQTSDKNITIIHSMTPVHQLMSCEVKSCMFLRNNSSLRYCNFKSSSEYHNSTSKVQNSPTFYQHICLEPFWTVFALMDLLQTHSFSLHKMLIDWKGKGSGVWPSMVTHTRNLSSAFNPSKCTLTAVNIHLEQWAAILRRLGSRWGIGALLKGLTSVVVLKVERALVIHSPHRQSLPDLGIEPATFGLQVQLSNH